MFWKIYAIIITLFTLVGSVVILPSIGSWRFAEWEGFIESILLVLGVLAFAYKKNLFNSQFWKVVFIAIILMWTGEGLSYLTNSSYLDFFKITVVPFGGAEILTSVILGIPALVAIYKLGFSKKPLL